MKTTEAWLGAILFLLPAAAFATEEPARPMDDHPEWFACASSSECTTVQQGCYYWQPVNATYASRLPPSSCLKSNPPGPQPAAVCMDHRCENAPFAIRDWNRLESYQKFQLVSTGVEICRQASGLTAPAAADPSMTSRYEAALDKSIQELRFPDDKLLSDAVKEVVPCEELVTWERDQKKWEALQSQDGSARRVLVEQVQPRYSLNGLYPALTAYAKVFQQCGQRHSRQDVTFWGDMNVDFTILPDGTMESGSVNATYPGVAYMRPFLDCAGTAFQRLTFPKPKDGRSIRVKALVRVQSVMSR